MHYLLYDFLYYMYRHATLVYTHAHGAHHHLMNSWLSLGVHLDMIFTPYEDKNVDTYITEWGYIYNSMRIHI
jgi:hypothetical protein